MSTANETPQPDPQPPAQVETFDLARAEYSDIAAKEIGLPSLESMKLLKRVAKELAGTPFCPEAFRNAPEAIFAAALTGREMGLAPLQSLRSFWPSPDGRLGMYSQAMMALMLQKGFKFEWHRCDGELCEVTATRPDGGSSLKTSWGKDDTKQAGLTSEKKQHGRYPVDMNMNRCVGRIFRFLGADLGGNTMYSPEEIQDSIEAGNATDTAATALPVSTEVKAGTRPKQKPEDITVEAKAEPVAEKTAAPVIPIDSKTASAEPPNTAPPVTRTPVRTEHLVYVGGKPVHPAHADFAAAAQAAQAARDQSHMVVEVERIAYYSDSETERKMVAKFDPEPVTDTAQTTAAPAETAPAEIDPEKKAALDAAKARFEAIQASLPAKTDEDRKKIMVQFANGYYGVNRPKEWPKGLPVRHAMMDALTLSLERQTDRDFVVKSPKAAGEQAKLRGEAVVDPVYAKLGYSPETIKAATAFRNLFQFQTEQDFHDYVEMFLKCEEPDAYAYMRLAVIAGRGGETLKLLRETSKAMGEPYGAVIGTVAKYVGELSSENLKAIDGGLKKMLARATETAAPAAVAETAEPAASEDDDAGWS